MNNTFNEEDSDNQIINIVKDTIREFYSIDQSLINKNLCERCLVHRFAFYLQLKFNKMYVDCEFNKSFYGEEVHSKILSNINGNYVDIIIHKRDNIFKHNLICFEVKKKNNKKDREKDKKNLEILTKIDYYQNTEVKGFNYLYGFNFIIGKTIYESELFLYKNGSLVKSIIPFN